MVAVPLGLTLLHAILYPSDEVTDAFDDPVMSMVPGAARVKQALEKKASSTRMGSSKRVAPAPTSSTEDATDVEVIKTKQLDEMRIQKSSNTIGLRLEDDAAAHQVSKWQEARADSPVK